MLLGVMSKWKLLACFIMLFRRIKIFEQSLCVFFYAKYLCKKKKTIPITSFTILLLYSYFLLFIFISLVRASSGDSVLLFISDKDSFID